MRIPGKILAGLAAGLIVAVLVTFVVVRTWVVPAVIVGQIRARTGGTVTIRDWWLNGQSAGVVGLTVRDAPSEKPWASAERVTTDLTLGGVFRGHFAPGKITLNGPEVALRFDEKGKLLTKIGGKSAGGTGALPLVIANDAKITMRQEGRPAMVVNGVTARLGPTGDRLLLSARSNDRQWGPFEAHGESDPAFQVGSVDLKTTGNVTATPEKARAIPFVPAEVWQNVAPGGEVGVNLHLAFDHGAVHVRTEIKLLGTKAESQTLGLTASKVTGVVVVDDALVTFQKVTGQAIGGQIAANGTADFRKTPARFDMALRLDQVNVADTPKAWQLDEAALSGQLSGDVHLLATLGAQGVDLSGTSGEAVVKDGTIQGIPFKSLKLVMKASGDDLQYGTNPEKTSADLGPRFQPRPLVWLIGLTTVALQAPETKAGGPETDKTKPARTMIKLPKSIVTHLELDDVDMVQLIAKAQFLLGYPFPVPMTGRLSLSADATIPLGKGSSLKDYQFHGQLTLKKSSIYQVDLGRVTARIDVADGVVDLTDFRGHLVDRPNGGPDNPPEVEGQAVPISGPLPPGSFRGALHAAFSPAGKMTARFEGNRLPLGELGAPVLPRPTPLSGLATMKLEASGDLGAASNPNAWTASGTAESEQIQFKGAALETVAVTFGFKEGKLDVSELTALLRGRPLKARASVALNPPRAFQGIVDVAGWDLTEILAWVPRAPHPAPVAGTVSARAKASGTLQPFALKTEGHGSFERLQAGPVALGAVPFEWETKGDLVTLAVKDARPFGGRLSADAEVPLTPGKPIQGRAKVESIDTAAMSAAVPDGNLKLSGRASGSVTFSIPKDVKALDATVKLNAPDLTVQGIPAEQVKASVRARKGSLGYEISADSLGGAIRFEGSFPLGASPMPRAADGELRAVGFSLERAWKALGVSGMIARLSGRGAIDANLRAAFTQPGVGLYAHGLFELRDLTWGDSGPLGGLKGVLKMTPEGWRVESINGDLLGGVASGFLWGSPPDPASQVIKPKVGFNLRLDRLELIDLTAFLPSRFRIVTGYATVRMAGTLSDVFRGAGDLNVQGAKLGGLTINELKIPVEVSTTGGFGSGVVQLRRYSGRIAGGRFHGDGWFHLGEDQSFQATLNLTDVELESITRIESDARRPASGKVSGLITVQGPDPSKPQGYRGKVNLSLDDASLVTMPVFRELDRFLGSSRGGMFEAGDLTGTIANGQLIIESATLQGRLAQMHISGTVGFDSQVNLEVLVNMNQIIPQAGAALVSAVPGLRGAARDSQASLEVSNYLSNRLLKLRVTGTVKNPSVNLDPGVAVAGSAVGFFTGILKLPLGLVK